MKTPTIQFYHLRSTSRERAVPKLMEKALATGSRVVVMANSDATLKTLSEALWTNDPASFLPHGSAREALAAEHPIILTLADENPNGADILCVLDGVSPASLTSYAKVLDVFDGSNEEDVLRARERWSAYKTAGHKLQYVKQQQGGGWKVEAEA